MNDNITAGAIALSAAMPLVLRYFPAFKYVIPYLVVWSIVVIMFIRELIMEEKP